MKHLTSIAIAALMAIVAMGSCSSQKSTRDYAYEAYCDSIWANDPDYYLDVLVTTDEFQDYIEANGQWWEEDCPAYLEMKAANDFKREVIDAQDACLKEAELIMLRNGLYDEYYSRLKFKVDSLYSTQL